MKWRLSSFAWNDPTTRRELRAARNRKLTLRLKAPSTLAFSLPGDHEQATFIEELITDIVVTADGADLVWVRCGQVTDTVSETGYGMSCQAADYREVLKRRMVKTGDTLNFNNVEQALIAWTMISQVQSRANGSYGISQGIGSTTGVSRIWNLKPGSKVAAEIDSISEYANGFEWDISPDKKFNVYFPSRGGNNGVGLEYGKTVSSFTRTKAPASFANDGVFTGGQGTTPVEQSSTTINSDPTGRWDQLFPFPTITNQTTLAAKGPFTIAQSSSLRPSYNVDLVPGFWEGEGHIGRGDIVRFRAVRGRINENDLFRVIDIAVSIRDEGGEGKGGEDVRLGLVPT